MITDAYTIQFLLEETLATPSRLQWREISTETCGLVTQTAGVELFLEEVHARPASRVCLKLRCGGEEFSVYAPLPTGWFGSRYQSAAEADLAHLLNQLFHAALAQCTERRIHGLNHPEEIRERLYRRVLFGPTSESESKELAQV